MRETLIKMAGLLDDARRAHKRSYNKRALALVADIRNLASSLMPPEPIRCWCCGMKTDQAMNDMIDRKFEERQKNPVDISFLAPAAQKKDESLLQIEVES